MDPAISAVIVAVITGIFTVVTVVLQRRQDKVINKIEQQTGFIEKEKSLRQELARKEKECDNIIQQMMILILETNLSILKNTQVSGMTLDEEVFEASETLKERFKNAYDETSKLRDKYDIVLQMADEFKLEIGNGDEKKSKR